LYIGDSKLPARETRAFVHAGGDYYLAPLSKVQLPQAVLDGYLAPVWEGQQSLQTVSRSAVDGEPRLIVEGFERQEPMAVELEDRL